MNSSAKNEFLKNEIWLLAFGGAFQRSNIYKPNTTELERKHFRIKLRGFIEDTILERYNKKVDESDLLEAISSISGFTQNFKDELKQPLKIGVSQKLLNLVLKYYWCLGWIAEPPHFPVDRIIQKELPLHKRMNWTTLDSIEDYMSIVAEARNQLQKDETPATWELRNFRRNSAL